jgi:hypothetical protein
VDASSVARLVAVVLNGDRAASLSAEAEDLGPDVVELDIHAFTAETVATDAPGLEAARKSLHAMDELREHSMGLGIWKAIDPDEYVRELREGWD